MLAFWGLHFNHTWDLTAVGTIALAIVTFISLIFARSALDKTQAQIELGQAQLKQTQEEIALSRKEVEEAHRPVIVPIVDPPNSPTVTRLEGPLRGTLSLPVQNIGSGPALRVEGTVTIATTDGVISTPPAPHFAGTAMGIAAGQMAWLDGHIRPSGGLEDFELRVTFEDLGGQGWVTFARWDAARSRYTDLAVNTQAEGTYGLKQDTELVKPVLPGS
jgi:hypothetical protein